MPGIQSKFRLRILVQKSRQDKTQLNLKFEGPLDGDCTIGCRRPILRVTWLSAVASYWDTFMLPSFSFGICCANYLSFNGDERLGRFNVGGKFNF